ncbi:hypothetical protein TWF106_005497 [Orbilia oligospora]|uniref:F-box domain-containing protein n=1 Tax=Orbilia oligospora TaxID=2813651 RepID=A0A6G1LVQ0_ORBOL|nr:hypothetical protein TWF191_010544 [Orbilia oligospora]KAF3222693.1 hypothetical protein TWF106_005497 [Orbilia oligospora]KAF3233910.1 hypothetical protein TWF192_001761 [Orbilia oligospora]
MSTIFLTLPFEILELINSYLFPRDIASLSLTCKTFKDRLGSGNQYFWYQILRQTLTVPKPGRVISPKIVRRTSNLQEFNEEVNYWSEASDLFAGRKLYACRYCLEADPLHRRDGDRSFAFKSKGAVFGGDTIQQFCANCRRDWFTDLKTFTSGFPEYTPLPKSIYHPVYGESFIQIPSLIKYIESKGTPYSTIISPSFKFKAKWTASRDKKEAGYIDQALCLLRDSYKQQYRHLHIVLTPNGYYNLLTFTLYRDVLNHTSAHPANVVIFSEKIINHIMAFIPILEDKDEKSTKKAIDLAATINRELLGDPNDFNMMSLIYPDSVVIRKLLEPLTNPGQPFNWILLYSKAYFDSTADDVRCYWCLRSNGGKDAETNRFRYRSFLSKDPQHVPWITSHIISHHSDVMWTRPKNNWVHENFSFYSSRFGRRHAIVYLDGLHLPAAEWEKLKVRPDFENETLEKISVDFPVWCEGRVTPSEYFMM